MFVQNLGRRYGTSKMHFSPGGLGCCRSKALILSLLICCLWLLLLWESVIVLKGVKKVRSTIKLYSYYFSYYVSNDIDVTVIL